jgi:hypothetical protein
MPAYNPIAETEYLIESHVVEAEDDGVLEDLVSTYDPASDRLVPGTGLVGPRALTFAPILVGERLPLAALLRRLLAACEESLGSKVEIEFAMTLDRAHAARGASGRDAAAAWSGADPAAGEVDPRLLARFGFLQVRPLALSDEFMELPAEKLRAPRALLASESTLGNGTVDGIRDVVYVKPESFDTSKTRTIAAEIERMNQRLLGENRPYVLIGFGRWGSADPWLGIPVAWSQIAGARAIVESTRPDLQTDPSQGSHFFHNITSFRIAYFSVRHGGAYPIRFEWLDARPAAAESAHVRHVRWDRSLEVLVDGRTGRGVILVPEDGEREAAG